MSPVGGVRGGVRTRGPMALCRMTFRRTCRPTYNPYYSLQPGQLARPTVRVISLESIKTNFPLLYLVFAHTHTIIHVCVHTVTPKTKQNASIHCHVKV